jgi:uracil-DNA glycosylase
LEKEYGEKEIFPKKENIFKALEKTNLEDISVIIIGQDPYHTPDIAEGLAFSIPPGKKVLPSVKNIFKEMESDLKIKKNFKNGNLEYLTNQGVLLLNQVLTVEAHKPGSHWKQG